MSQRIYPNELYHYGVLGMKWGQHRASKKGASYTYKSWTTKHNEKKMAGALKKRDAARSAGKTEKANKQLGKYKVFERRADRSRRMDRFEQNRANRKNTGTVLATRTAASLFAGNPAYMFGGLDKAYSQHQAISNSKGKDTKAIETKGLDFAKSFIFGRPGSTIAKQIHIRSGEREFVKNHYKDPVKPKKQNKKPTLDDYERIYKQAYEDRMNRKEGR